MDHRSLAHLLDGVHELRRTRLGDLSEVGLQLLLGHAHTTVLKDKGFRVLQDDKGQRDMSSWICGSKTVSRLSRIPQDIGNTG